MTASSLMRGMGAIIGDIVGSPYEFDRGDKSEDFPLFSETSAPTDDSVLTLAVAEGLVSAAGQGLEAARESVIKKLRDCVKILEEEKKTKPHVTCCEMERS